MTRTGLAGTAALVCSLAVTVANSQSFYKVGDLLDKGATRIEAADLKALLSDARVSGKSITNLRFGFEATYLKDGTFQGSADGSHSEPPFAIQGTWTVDEQGRLCTETSSRYGTTKGCGPYYRYQNAYFQAVSTERDAVATSREIKR